MTSLITDLETAKAGSRELSDRVLEALGCEYTSPSGKCLDDNPDAQGVWWTGKGGFPGLDPTRSLDDALTLVPEGWDDWAFNREHNSGCSAWLYRIPALDEAADGLAKTPALALCAAILRAKQHEGTGNE